MLRKQTLVYVLVLLVFGVGTLLVLKAGSQLSPPTTVSVPVLAGGGWPGSGSFTEHLQEPLSILLLQVLVIVVVAHAFGGLVRKLGQPAVIGEMVAGILLGPSLLGWVWPEAEAFLFPAGSMGALRLFSQVGVILFMFAVGMQVDVEHLREKAHAAVLVSHASIVVPFFLGTAFTLVIYRALAPAHIAFSGFALFMGVSMSITAFPVLARIIAERGLTGSALGNTAIACAAIDDVTAWCLLAVVVAMVKAGALSSTVVTILLVLLFVGLMLFVIKPLANRFFGHGVVNQPRGHGILAIILAFVFASALATEVIGIHALFGAFLAGVVMPADTELRQFLRRNVEAFSVAFLLPLFFAFTGLRTQVGLLNDWAGWAMCAGVIAVAVAGKLGGSALAARWTGMNWRDALALGVLMNTRGLVELIVLNIGYDLGILSPRCFAIMILMALATTLMTGPLLSVITKKS